MTVVVASVPGIRSSGKGRASSPIRSATLRIAALSANRTASAIRSAPQRKEMSMNSRKAVRLSVAVLLAIGGVPLAEAQLTRSWVASSGLDTNDCTRPTPCRTFGRAMSVSNSGAEVVVMDSAGYGPFTINKPISIISPPAFHAAIAPTSGTAITISSGISGAVVIRGLYLNGQGATNGILQQGNNALIMENVVISGFTTGLNFDVGTTPRFIVTDSTIRNSSDGILWKGASPGRGVLERTRLENNTVRAFYINSGGTFSIRDSIVTEGSHGVFLDTLDPASVDLINSAVFNNDGIGIYASASGAGAVDVNLDHCLMSRNGSAIVAQSPVGASVIRVAQSLIANNNNGVSWGGAMASVISRGDNTLENNNSGNTFTSTYPAK